MILVMLGFSIGFILFSTKNVATGGKITVSDQDGINEIYVMNSDGSDQMRLTNNSRIAGNPSFSPDGSKIVFSNLQSGLSEILMRDINATNQLIAQSDIKPLGSAFLQIAAAWTVLQESFDQWNNIPTSFIDMQISRGKFEF